MINPVTLESKVPGKFLDALLELSEKTSVSPDVLQRLAIYDFLVKFKALEEGDEIRDEYGYLYRHFEEERKRNDISLGVIF